MIYTWFQTLEDEFTDEERMLERLKQEAEER